VRDSGPLDETQGGKLVGRLGMPPWIPRLVGIIAVLCIGLFFAFQVVRALRELLVLLLISLFLSIALEPGVNFLASKGWRRGLATGLIFLIMVLVAGLFVGLMVPLVVNQVSHLVSNLPGYVDEAAKVAKRFGIDFSSDRVRDALSSANSNLQRIATDVAGSIFGVGAALMRTVFQLLTIGLFTFYMTADGPRLRRTMLSVLPARRQHEVLWVMDVAINKTGGYFYSRALLAAISTAVAWGAFAVIGVPYTLALALWMGLVSQFVPVVGTYIGGFLPLVVALVESPPKAIAVLGYIVAFQAIENYLLAPKILARTMSLHPAVAFGSAIAGGTLLGVPGALMALPVAATIQAFISTYLRRHEVVDSPLTFDSRAQTAVAPAETVVEPQVAPDPGLPG
jgi:predicted PurR-regulated permease PerM